MTDGDRYRRGLLFLLSSATFFEGYDTFVLALILGDLLGVRPTPAGSARSHSSARSPGSLRWRARRGSGVGVVLALVAVGVLTLVRRSAGRP